MSTNWTTPIHAYNKWTITDGGRVAQLDILYGNLTMHLIDSGVKVAISIEAAKILLSCIEEK